jgi:hypothetical protein
MLQRLQNDALARILHNSLYQRMLTFCEQYTPEFPAHFIVSSWMNRLFSGDSNLHILVRLKEDSYKIIGHAVIDVQEAYGHRVVFCHQVQGDIANVSHVDEGAEYIDKLVAAVGAQCSVMYTSKHVKAYEKKYGYKSVRTVMMKCVSDEAETYT